MANQFGRKIDLVVSAGTLAGSPGLDLSGFRVRFETFNDDAQSPNQMYVRIYNLGDQTANRIGKEFTAVTLQAGYETGNFGIIFEGTIVEVRRGRESNVDSYVDIWAADGDDWYNFAVIDRAVSAGATPAQIIKQITSATSTGTGDALPFADDVSGLIEGTGAGTAQALSRGKTMFGMARDYARDWADKYGYRWSIQGGKFVVVPITGYRPGEAVVLSSTTGLVGIPEATDGGVNARALLNPVIRIGCLVQIARSDLNQITYQQQGLSVAPAIASTTTAQGFYRVLQAKFTGDTRGNDWYVDLICIAVDVSASDQSNSVAVSG